MPTAVQTTDSQGAAESADVVASAADESDVVTPPGSPGGAPTAPDARRAGRRLALVIAGLAVVCAVIATAATMMARLFGHRTAADIGPSAELLAKYERLARSPLLDEVPLPPRLDAAAGLAAVAKTRPPSLGPVPVHAEFDAAARTSIHAFFAACLTRATEIWPGDCSRWGRHPHRRDLHVPTREEGARWDALCADAIEVLENWPAAQSLSPHDRTDRETLIAAFDMFARSRETDAHTAVASLGAMFPALASLAAVRCCPVADRIGVATARLRLMPQTLDRVTPDLDPSDPAEPRPGRAEVRALLRHMEDAAAWLNAYPDEWSVGSDAPSAADIAALREACATARAGVAGFVEVLRRRIVVQAADHIGNGRENLAVTLRLHLGVTGSPRALYEEALDELRDALAAIRRWDAGPAPVPDVAALGDDDEQIRTLRAAVPRWTGEPAPGPELRVAQMSGLWSKGYEVFRLDAYGFDAPCRGVVQLAASTHRVDAQAAAWDAVWRHHSIARVGDHGRGLAIAYGSRACDVRRFAAVPVIPYGWEVRALDLIHDAGMCVGGAMDERLRAVELANAASDALLALLMECGAVTTDEAIELMPPVEGEVADVAEVGDRAAWSTDALATFVGRREIAQMRDAEARRRGPSFDERAFHVRLLSAGAILPALIEAEWAAEGE